MLRSGGVVLPKNCSLLAETRQPTETSTKAPSRNPVKACFMQKASLLNFITFRHSQPRWKLTREKTLIKPFSGDLSLRTNRQLAIANRQTNPTLPVFQFPIRVDPNVFQRWQIKEVGVETCHVWFDEGVGGRKVEWNRSQFLQCFNLRLDDSR